MLRYICVDGKQIKMLASVCFEFSEPLRGKHGVNVELDHQSYHEKKKFDPSVCVSIVKSVDITE